jgi:opacity protein-like surface antigen
MKQYVAVIIAGVMTLAGTVHGGSTYLGGNIGAGVANDNVDTGLALSGYLEADMNDNIALRGTLGYFGGDTKVDLLSEGDFTMFSMEASVIVKARRSSNIIPYAGAGVGYYFPDNELSSNVENVGALLGFRLEEDIDEAFGFHVLAGLAVNLGQNLDLDLGVKYIVVKPDVEAKVTDLSTFQSVTVQDEVDLNTLFITAGLRLTF